ncbi:MAG: cation:dicarboxylase symporter family transporter [Candidatus Omnitrophica bacterium]|nr:cation:dicarboxylase symporter family transporter [Candidatus Omnitrophota bacterium]
MTQVSGKKKHWLLSPWTIFAGIILGCVIGVGFKDFSAHLTVLADIFLALLQMCVIPIIITAVVSSLARLVARRVSVRFMVRLVAIFALGLIFASLMGLAAGLWGKPGADLDENARRSIGQMIAQYEVKAASDNAAGTEGLAGFQKVLSLQMYSAP